MKVYETYRFVDKDPVIDRLRTIMEDQKVSNTYVANKSGVAVHTLRQWFAGKTKRPQHATVAAVAAALGYEFVLRAKDSATGGAQIIPIHAKRRRA